MRAGVSMSRICGPVVIIPIIIFILASSIRIDRLTSDTEQIEQQIDMYKDKIEMYEKQPQVNVDKVVYYDINLSEDIQDYLFAECEKRDVDAVLVLALIKTESNFTADIVSGTNDYGLMQINAVNHSWLQEKLGTLDFLDAKDNIKAGVYMLSRLEPQDVNQKLMVYNMGGAQAKVLWDSGVYNTEYTDIVISNMDYIKEREVIR